MDDCGVMSAMTATTSGRAKFDFQAETCFLEVRQSGRTNGTSNLKKILRAMDNQQTVFACILSSLSN